MQTHQNIEFVERYDVFIRLFVSGECKNCLLHFIQDQRSEVTLSQIFLHLALFIVDVCKPNFKQSGIHVSHFTVR